MSDVTPSFFVKELTDKKAQNTEGVAKDFNLTELIDPKNVDKKDFVYDYDHAQNFDESKVKMAREGAKEILADAINRAKTQAVKIREEARKLGYEEGKLSYEKARKSGFDEGHRDGFEKGEDLARKEFANLFNAFKIHNRELSEFRRKMYGKLEREMIEMVTTLSKKVIYHDLKTREDSIQQMIRLAVESVLDKESMKIKVHPTEKDYAEKFQPELNQIYQEIRNITFEASPALERGDCIIETNFGTIDGRLQNISEEIDKLLALTPVSFEEGQTQFPKQNQTEKLESHSIEEKTKELKIDKETDETNKSFDGNEDIDDFDFPELKEPDQET